MALERIRVGVVDSRPHIWRTLERVAQSSTAGFQLGTVSSSWDAFVRAWDASDDVIVFKSALRDHVPAVLKARAIARLKIIPVAVETAPAPLHRFRLRESGARVIRASDGLNELGKAILAAETQNDGFEPSPEHRAITLSDRELQAACLFVGKFAPTAAQISALLNVDISTVRGHLARAREKFSARGIAASTRGDLRNALFEGGWMIDLE